MNPLEPHAGNIDGNPEPYYSNEDVAILHDIVVTAEELLPELPERERLPTNALFRAYSRILPQIGIDADHDSRYARILFKIGGLRKDGTLVERLRDVLSRMGIELEFDRVPSPVSNDANEQWTVQKESTTVSSVSVHPPKRRQRSKSDSSANPTWRLETALETTQPALARARSAWFDLSPGRNSIPLSARATINTIEVLPKSPGSNLEGDDGFSSHRTIANEEIVGRRFSTVVKETREAEFEADPSQYTDRRTNNDHDEPSEHPIIRWSRETNMDKAASYRRASLLREHIRIWRTETTQLRDDLHQLDRVATQTYHKSLLCSVLGIWRGMLDAERLFRSLENRVEQARDLQRLSKACGHWYKSALDGAEKTIAARSHVLRTRYFNAWRDITMVNDIKARRLTAKWFLRRWRRRRRLLTVDDNESIINFEHKLARNTFSTWVWKARARNAERIHDQYLKARHLCKVQMVAKESARLKEVALDHRVRSLAKATLITLRSCLTSIGELESRAEAFRKRQLFKYLEPWRRESLARPVRQRSQNNNDTRLKRVVLDRWLVQAQLERQATAVDRERMLREGLALWRTRSRLLGIRRRIEERTIRAAMSTWQLAERERLFQRNSELNLKLTLLRAMVHSWHSCKPQNQDDDLVAQHYSKHKLELAAWRGWRAQNRQLQDLNDCAAQTFQTHTLQRFTTKWTTAMTQRRTQQQEAIKAGYYILSFRYFKQWRQAAKESKRDRLRDAVRIVRRAHKINLARSGLQIWRQRADNVSQLGATAKERTSLVALRISQEKLVLWRSQVDVIWKNDGEAVSWYQQLLLGKMLQQWRSRSTHASQLNADAQYHHQAHQTAVTIRQWSGAALQRGAREHIAAGLRERFSRKNTRRIVMFWLQQSRQRRVRGERLSDPDADVSSHTLREDLTSDDDTEMDFGDLQGEVAVSSHPVPGYLKTPSLRKSMAMSRYSTTPIAPLSTPFEKHLRRQYDFGRLRAKQPFREAPNLKGFQDIQDR